MKVPVRRTANERFVLEALSQRSPQPSTDVDRHLKGTMRRMVAKGWIDWDGADGHVTITKTGLEVHATGMAEVGS